MKMIRCVIGSLLIGMILLSTIPFSTAEIQESHARYRSPRPVQLRIVDVEIIIEGHGYVDIHCKIIAPAILVKYYDDYANCIQLDQNSVRAQTAIRQHVISQGYCGIGFMYMRMIGEGPNDTVMYTCTVHFEDVPSGIFDYCIMAYANYGDGAFQITGSINGTFEIGNINYS